MQCFIQHAPRNFKDRLVRQALAYAFDFEWSNINLFYGQYIRTKSYFSNSELASTGLPSPAELEILEPYRGQILTKSSRPSMIRRRPMEPAISANLRKATELLKQAGWEVRDGVLINAQTGKTFEFEVLLIAGDLFERITQPFVQNLERLGESKNPQCRFRTVSSAKCDSFDFDMIVETIGQSSRPATNSAISGFRQRRHTRRAQYHRHQGQSRRRVGRSHHLRAGSRGLITRTRIGPGSAEPLRHPPLAHQ
jgi:microcin C transport system substrate-binding protein